jgi:hypothetical protein
MRLRRIRTAGKEDLGRCLVHSLLLAVLSRNDRFSLSRNDRFSAAGPPAVERGR